MQARGPLMVEHRLIERMIGLIKAALGQIESENKEENILFRALDKKNLSFDDRQVMKELIDEHVFGRKTTKALVAANTRYRDGDATALADIAEKLKTLVDFYPKHIRKEDEVFFPHLAPTSRMKKTK